MPYTGKFDKISFSLFALWNVDIKDEKNLTSEITTVHATNSMGLYMHLKQILNTEDTIFNVAFTIKRNGESMKSDSICI